MTFASKHEGQTEGNSSKTNDGHHSNIEHVSLISKVALIDDEDLPVKAEDAEFDGA